MFQFGTAGNSTERAPAYRHVDLSLFKDFHVWREKQVLGSRADFYNNINDSSFGLINTVRSPARQIQLSLHYSF